MPDAFDFRKHIVDYDVFQQIDMNNAYYGFCKPGCKGLTDNKWSILKMETAGGVTTKKWAEGNKNGKALQFSERAAYDYSFLK